MVNLDASVIGKSRGLLLGRQLVKAFDAVAESEVEDMLGEVQGLNLRNCVFLEHLLLYTHEELYLLLQILHHLMHHVIVQLPFAVLDQP